MTEASAVPNQESHTPDFFIRDAASSKLSHLITCLLHNDSTNYATCKSCAPYPASPVLATFWLATQLPATSNAYTVNIM
eukprot:12429409-Karenia_brevis.AAC.1